MIMELFFTPKLLTTVTTSDLDCARGRIFSLMNYTKFIQKWSGIHFVSAVNYNWNALVPGGLVSSSELVINSATSQMFRRYQRKDSLTEKNNQSAICPEVNRVLYGGNTKTLPM